MSVLHSSICICDVCYGHYNKWGPLRSYVVILEILCGPLRCFWRSFAVLCGPLRSCAVFSITSKLGMLFSFNLLNLKTFTNSLNENYSILTIMHGISVCFVGIIIAPQLVLLFTQVWLSSFHEHTYSAEDQ